MNRNFNIYHYENTKYNSSDMVFFDAIISLVASKSRYGWKICSETERCDRRNFYI